MKSSKAIFPLCLLCALFISACTNDIRIYVSPEGNDQNPGSKSSPLLSPEAAKNMASGLVSDNPKKDIRVIFKSGFYELANGLVFKPEDGGTNDQKIIFQSGKGENAIISGGSQIKEWEARDDGLWEAKISRGINFEQLYINGQRAVRARIPNLDAEPSRWYLDSVEVAVNQETGMLDRMKIGLRDEGALLNLPLEGESEIVIFKDWATLRKQVSGINTETGMLEMKPPLVFFEGNYNGLMAPYSDRFTCFLEGNKDFLDQAGEWAYDRDNGILLYYPLPGMRIDSTEAVISLVKTIVSLKGEKDKRIRNIHFENIRFHHAAYLLPDFGHDGRQACFYYSEGTGLKAQDAIIEHAVRAEWAENCSFNGCEIAFTGANGIFITRGSHHTKIENTRLFEIGGNGLMIGTAFDPQEDSSSLVNNVLISGCELYKAGQHYQSAVGIWLGFAAGCNISGNHVYDMPYTGISVGWQWNPLPTSSKNNLIAGNHIHDVMKMLGDGGGIYTLGYQPGSIIKDNEIHDILRSELNHASPNNGMFIDEGSKGYLVEGNHIYRVAHTCIRGHRAAGVELKNNIFEPGEMPAISHTPPYNAMIFANKDSTIVWPNPGWPKEWGYPDTITAFRMEGNVFK